MTSRRSTSVVLPWSTWAMTATLRIGTDMGARRHPGTGDEGGERTPGRVVGEIRPVRRPRGTWPARDPSAPSAPSQPTARSRPGCGGRTRAACPSARARRPGRRRSVRAPGPPRAGKWRRASARGRPGRGPDRPARSRQLTSSSHPCSRHGCANVRRSIGRYRDRIWWNDVRNETPRSDDANERPGRWVASFPGDSPCASRGGTAGRHRRSGEGPRGRLLPRSDTWGGGTPRVIAAEPSVCVAVFPTLVVQTGGRVHCPDFMSERAPEWERRRGIGDRVGEPGPLGGCRNHATRAAATSVHPESPSIATGRRSVALGRGGRGRLGHDPSPRSNLFLRGVPLGAPRLFFPARTRDGCAPCACA